MRSLDPALQGRPPHSRSASVSARAHRRWNFYDGARHNAISEGQGPAPRHRRASQSPAITRPALGPGAPWGAGAPADGPPRALRFSSSRGASGQGGSVELPASIQTVGAADWLTHLARDASVPRRPFGPIAVGHRKRGARRRAHRQRRCAPLSEPRGPRRAPRSLPAAGKSVPLSSAEVHSLMHDRDGRVSRGRARQASRVPGCARLRNECSE